jgi:glutaredoxin
MTSPKYPVDLHMYSNHESRVVVYTTTGCPKCNMLKEWLRSRKNEFEEKDLDDVDIMAELVMRNEVVLSAPALEVGKALYRQDEIFDKDGRINGELLRILEGK